ncbi:unnamed protein product, partial [Mesorhabditis belari]|uniref:CUB domain-containing protein n=1 Tax=Mesorhabditis belari TaxID=2138241 RepID=A0AAF3F4Z9_9BILA
MFSLNSLLFYHLFFIINAAIFGSISTANSDRCHCSNKIIMLFAEDDYRVINTPDYPRPYCPKLDCLWRIVAPTNESRIYFFTDNLDLRPNEDFVEFYDQKFVTNPRNETVTARCTGNVDEEKICRFQSAGQYLSIRFVSGSGESDRYGFQGIVSPYDRETRALMSFLTRCGFYVLIGGGCLVAGILCACLFKKRKDRNGDPRLIVAPGVSDAEEKALL